MPRLQMTQQQVKGEGLAGEVSFISVSYVFTRGTCVPLPEAPKLPAGTVDSEALNSVPGRH